MLAFALALACRAPEPPSSAAQPKAMVDTGAAASPLVFTGSVPRNLLIVSLDTMRRDYVGYFTGKSTTPFLDELMGESVVLADHRSCSSWTGPSQICATTGRTPFRMGFWPDSGDSKVPNTPSTLDTIAAALQADGFATSLVSSNPWYFGYGGVSTGFDAVVLNSGLPAPSVASKAIIQANKVYAGTDPWYFHVHFFDPHEPYIPPSSYLAELRALPPIGYDVTLSSEVIAVASAWSRRPVTWQVLASKHLDAVYRAEVAYWDDEFEKFWDKLDAGGLLDDTLVVFWTDHGQQHMEHGWVHHGVALYAEENRSTGFFWAKNLAPQDWTGPTTHVDLATTILDLYGQDVSALEGYPLGQRPESEARWHMLHWSWDQANLAVDRGGKQLHYDWDGNKGFYDLTTDPTQTTNLYDSTDPDVVDLWTDMDALVREVRTSWSHLGMPTDAGP